MRKFEKVHKIITNMSLISAHIELNISFMSVYYGSYCAKFDICSFISINKTGNDYKFLVGLSL